MERGSVSKKPVEHSAYYFRKEGENVIHVGIDVAKEKHDCCILAGDGTLLRTSFAFRNSREGFQKLLSTIEAALQEEGSGQIKAGLEATGHYSEALMAFLQSSGIQPVIFNPLQVNLYRKSLSLRKTKTDKVDAKCIAQLLLSAESTPAPESYQNRELKALTRHRARLVTQRSKVKVHLARLVTLLFPELPSICWSTSQKSMLALLAELPGANPIACCRIDRLTRLLVKASHGRYRLEKAMEMKALALQSVGLDSPALSFELTQLIQQIRFLQEQIAELDKTIRKTVQATNTPLLTIPGIGPILAAIILAEIGDIHRFRSPDQLLAFAGLEPSAYQSGQFTANRTPMVKRGSTYLRWALMQAARLAAIYCTTFRTYLQGKRSQGKHYFVALGHTSKKLVRVIFHILNANEPFTPQAA